MSDGRACLSANSTLYRRCARVIVVYYLKDFRTEQSIVGTEVDHTDKSFNRPVLLPPENRTLPLQLLRISAVTNRTPIRLRAIAQNTVTVTTVGYFYIILRHNVYITEYSRLTFSMSTAIPTTLLEFRTHRFL